MEARCEHCLDTGSLSKQIDGHLDCHYCEATEKRRKLRAHLAQFTAWPANDTATWAAYLFAQRQAAPVAPQPNKNALADEVIAALDALQVGCTEQSWIGWQNGDGEEVGTRLEAAITAYRASQPSDKAASFWSEVEARNHEVRPSQQVEEVGREPVAEIISDWQIVYVGTGPISPIIKKHGLKVGDFLYAAPQLEAHKDKK